MPKRASNRTRGQSITPDMLHPNQTRSDKGNACVLVFLQHHRTIGKKPLYYPAADSTVYSRLQHLNITDMFCK